jgi:single-stranded-DNA-specific exonuclease
MIHGYGLTPAIVDVALSMPEAPACLMTVDNGIASIDGVAHAKSKGLKVVITDHHLPADTTPQADAIVNPNQRGCTFESKHLAGVGVAFYVMLALRAHRRSLGKFSATQPEPRLDQLLDLVALGTVADVVKLDSLNRTLVYQGLLRIRQSKACAGINALFKIAGRDISRASAMDLGFSIGPRINAAGRLEDMSEGIRCLLSRDLSSATLFAQDLNETNLQRRELETQVKEDAQQDIAEMNLNTDQKSIVLHRAHWHAGVVGIVAGRIKEQYHRPCMVFAQDNSGKLKGSGRSIPGIHLRDVLDWVSKQDSTIFVAFGGHAMAAGASIYEDKLARFMALFEQAIDETSDPSLFSPVLAHDGAISQSDCSDDFMNWLENSVWGQGFPAPVFTGQFCILNQKLLQDKHLQLVIENTENKEQWKAIWFNQAHSLNETKPHYLAYQVQLNRFKGQTNLQLHIVGLVD